MKVISKTAMLIPHPSTGTVLSVIGFPGVIAISQMAIKITVPPKPMTYQTLPHVLTIGKVQNTCATPATKKKTPTGKLSPIAFEATNTCNIPPMSVHAPAA